MKRLLGILILWLCALIQVQGQSTYRLVEQGNKELSKESFSEAEVLYRKALEKDAALTIGQYNIGNARYYQNDFEAAIAKYEKTIEGFALTKDKAEAFHNIGNAYLSQEKYEESIEAYKSALKLVPYDMDTKYNLAYAQLKLKEQQEQEQQEQEEEQEEEEQEEEEKEEEEKEEDQNQDQEDDQEKDEGDEEESDEGKEKESDEGEEEKDGEGDEEKKDDSDGSEEEQKGENGEEEKPGNANEAELTQEEAEQILDMLQSEEGKLQERLDEEEKGDPVKVIFQKDW